MAKRNPYPDVVDVGGSRISTFGAMLTPCNSKESLHLWIKTFLGLDIPDCIVCDESTASPMDMIWNVYNASRTGDIDEASQLYFASRDSFKTMNAAIIELLLMLHFRLTASHMGAIKPQAKKCYEYVRGFLRLPLLNQIGQARDTMERTELDLETPWNVPPYLQIIVCTMAGTNSEHTNILCVADDTKISIRGDGDSVVSVDAKDIFVKMLCGEIVEFLTFNGGVLEFQKVVTASSDMKEIWRVTLGNGYVDASADHPFYIHGKGYVKLSDLRVDDSVLTVRVHEDGRHIEHDVVRGISYLRTGFVHDFSVEKNHNFFANGVLVHNCVDEVDVVRDFQAYQESKKIPTETIAVTDPRTGRIIHDKKPSVTLYISTRKSTFGLVQHEIDRASESGLKVRSWNIIDVTRACPEDKCKKSEGTVRLYFKQDTLSLISEEKFKELSPLQQQEWEPKDMYPGCVNCKIAPLCLGRLATKQKSSSPMLKTHNEVQKKFRESELSDALAQLMCLKPSTKGLVFTSFDERKSVMSPTQMWGQFVHGDPDWAVKQKKDGQTNSDIQITHDELIRTFQNHGVPAYAGVDWGFDHPSVCLVCFIDSGGNIYFVDEYAVTGMSDDEFVYNISHDGYGCVNFHKRYRIQRYFPDTSRPGSILTMKRNDLPVASKVDKDIHSGIQTIKRAMRVPGSNQSRFFVLRRQEIGGSDVLGPGCDLLIRQIQKYHLAMDASNKIIADDQYADEFDDAIDAARYVVHNIVGKSYAVISTASPGMGDPASFTKEGGFRGASMRPPTPAEVAAQAGLSVNDNRSVFFREDGTKKTDEEIEAYEKNRFGSKSGGGGGGGFNWSM